MNMRMPTLVLCWALAACFGACGSEKEGESAGPDVTAADTVTGGSDSGEEMVCPELFPSDRVVTVALELSEEAWAGIMADPEAEEFYQGNIDFDGVLVEGVGIRTKGNSSLHFVTQMGSERLPFKVDFNRYIGGLEFCGTKKLVFNNGFKDPTLMREHLAYRLARELGLKAPRTAFVDLTVAGNHLGLYTMVETVDDDLFRERCFGNDDGDQYKPEPPNGSLLHAGDTFADYPSIKVENNEDTTDHAALLQFIDVLNNGPPEMLPQVLDIDGALRHIAIDVALANLDSYTGSGHNYYLTEQDGVFSIILWDLNEAFGNFSCGCDRDGIINLRIYDPSCGPLDERPLIATLLGIAEYKDKYQGYLEMLANYYLGPQVMGAWVNEAADLIRPYVETDTTKFYSTEQFEQGIAWEDINDPSMPMGGSAIGLKAFIAERRASIEFQLAGYLPVDNKGKGSCGGGGGPGPGPHPEKCPDGICDEAEQANPKLCPEDCS